MKLPKVVKDEATAAYESAVTDHKSHIQWSFVGDKVLSVAITAYDREVVEPLVEAAKRFRESTNAYLRADTDLDCTGAWVLLNKHREELTAAITRYQSMKDAQ